jgi:hypothetical protein
MLFSCATHANASITMPVPAITIVGVRVSSWIPS